MGPAHPAPRAARMVTMLQLCGSLLAIPVGLASAYSIYKANFSPDTACLALRTNIIAMIDKKIDATTRRMLVRRDVETFEKSCGAFDPDAKAAFVTLLAAEPRTVAAHPAAKVEAPKSEPAKAETAKTEPAKIEPAKSEPAKAGSPAKDAVRKPEPRPAPVKQAAAPAAPEAEAVARDAAASDARWLDAVRGALVNHETAREAAAAIDAPVATRVAAPEIRGPVKTNAPAQQPAAAAPVAQPARSAPPQAPTQAPTQDAAAPVLPPATAVGEAPAPPPAAPPQRAADADHPVPPGSIPDGGQSSDNAVADADQPADSRFGWVSKIPLLGQAVK